MYTFSEAELRELYLCNTHSRDDIEPFIEVPVFCRSVDLVIQNKISSELSAIEFKLHDWKRAIQQVLDVRLCFDYLYICLPKPKTEPLINYIYNSCKLRKIGLIFFDVKANSFVTELEAPKMLDIWDKEKNRIISYLEVSRDGARKS